jgi:hypothetical protein
MTTPDQPTEQQQPVTPPPPRPPGMTIDVARLPIPGNAEFALYLAVMIVAWLVCWIADDLGSAAWLDLFKWVTIGYILSRGIAKASRVLEQ